MELKSADRVRKGFLPIATTRGDRLFIGLLIAAYVNLAFVGVSRRWPAGSGWSRSPIWIGFVVSWVFWR